MIGPSGSFSVKESFTCISKGLIYCLDCVKCGELYVRETGRKLADRFLEHRRNVLNNREENEVACHFNQEGHSVGDMRIQGMKYCNDLVKRRLEEQRLIARLGCVLGRGMNVDFHFPGLLVN